jgi:Flp pilus assembly protein TadD
MVPSHKDNLRTILICALLAAATLAVFWPVTRCEFINFDDPLYVTENPHVKQGLTWETVAWSFRASHASNWHPLTWLSHALDVQMFGLNPGLHHLTNLLFHSANTVLLFLLLERMTRRTWPSAMVAALFALHPVHVESVAWVSERKDMLSAFFFLLTLLAYARYAEEIGDRRQEIGAGARKWVRPAIVYLLSSIFFLLGLMSKPMLVTLPFVLLLLDYWPLQRLEIKNHPARGGTKIKNCVPLPSLHRSTTPPLRLVFEKLPFFALSAISCAVTFHVQHSSGAVMPLRGMTIAGRVENTLVAYVRYLGKAVWPSGLIVPYPLPRAWPVWAVAGAALLLILISGLVLAPFFTRPSPLAPRPPPLATCHPALAVGWLWFLGMLVPVIGLVQIGMASMADRYTYLPLIGIFVMVVWAASEVSNHRSVVSSGKPAAPVTSPRNRTQNTQHASRFTFQVSSFKFQVSSSSFLLTTAALGVLLACALTTRRQVCYWHDNIALFTHAIELFPAADEARHNLALALSNAGRLDKAISHFNVVLESQPDDAETHFHLAAALRQRGDVKDAVLHYRQGLRFAPDSPDALNNLAWILATYPDPQLRSGAEAVGLAERACKLTAYRKPMLVGTLAAAYAEAGRFAEAIAMAEKARALAEQAGQTELAAKNLKLLELYRAGKPARDAP